MQEVQQLGTLCLPEPVNKLVLKGQLEKKSLSQFFMSLQHHKNLNSLYLYNSRLDEDSFSCLQELPFLLELSLLHAYDGKKLCFHEKSLPKIKFIFISFALQLDQIEIKRGAMPNLQEIGLRDCPELKEIPEGVEYLTNLHRFNWGNPERELLEKLISEGTEEIECNKDQMRILPIIRFYNVQLKDREWRWERIHLL